MKSNLRVGAAALAFVGTAAVASSAAAQEVQAQGQAGMTLPGAAPRAAATMGESDHDAVIGTMAVGYLGRRGLNVQGPTGAGATPGEVAAAQIPVNAPIIGIRYWMDEMLGLDVGLGFGMTSGSTESGPNPTIDDPSTLGFMLHGGVPLSLADDGHFSFQVIPELNVGFGSVTVEAPAGGNDWSGSGFHLDVGARAGAEIHFGFIGVPKLSLQGNVGLYLAMESTSGELDGVPDSDSSRSELSIGTTVLDNPWNIFTSNVAALYYF